MDLFVQKFWGSICVCFMYNTVTDRVLNFRSFRSFCKTLKNHQKTHRLIPKIQFRTPDLPLITHIYDVEINIRISENIDKDVDDGNNKVAEDNAPRKLGCDAMFKGE